MVKRYTQTSGALVETFNTFDGRPSGQWVKHEDYQALQAVLKEALDAWEHADAYLNLDEYSRIAELRKQFLDI